MNAQIDETQTPPEESWIDEILKSLTEFLSAALRPLDDFLSALPIGVARGCAITLFLLVTVWVLTLKRELVFRGAPSQRPWRDLRLWAVLVALPYCLIYLFLF